MLEQLQAVFIHSTKQIKLRFRYFLPNRQLKILELLLNIQFIQSHQLTVYDFLTSIMTQLLSPIILMQLIFIQESILYLIQVLFILLFFDLQLKQ